MGFSRRLLPTVVAIWIVFFNAGLLVNGHFNYKEALAKSLVFLEAQRSGKLPPHNRVPWRGDSALEDGKLANVDLTGGYYDAGDNVKYGLPMAFTVTTLAWAAHFYHAELQATGELKHLHEAIRWGADYFLKCSQKHDVLYVQVGDPIIDHQCWMRPENMKTPRTVLQIDSSKPGTELAAETAAALAASAAVFGHSDKAYAHTLLNRAKRLFKFAHAHKGTFDGECPFYCSCSGFNDELLWAATWLYIASKKPMYLQYIEEESITANVAEFSWDLKYAGAQVLLSGIYFGGVHQLQNFKNQADNFVCAVLPESPYHRIYITPGGLIHLRDGANTQYVTSTAYLFSVYSDLLARHNQKVVCGSQQFDSTHLMAFAKQQMDYLLGKNPLGRSYMVGFGNNPPKQPHHRGASVPVMGKGTPVNCGMSFNNYFHIPSPNPNELTGAILGGPDSHDNFVDSRKSSAMTEPCTYINSLAVGVLAKLAHHK